MCKNVTSCTLTLIAPRFGFKNNKNNLEVQKVQALTIVTSQSVDLSEFNVNKYCVCDIIP